MKACPLFDTTGIPPAASHHLLGVPDKTRIVDDVRSRVPLERLLGQQTHKVVALYEIATLVEEEATIEITIPGYAEIGAVLHHSLRSDRPVLEQHGIGYPVRERPVGFVVDLDEFEGQGALKQIDDRPGATVAGVHDHLQGLQFRDVDVREQVLDVARTRVGLSQRSARNSRAVPPAPVTVARQPENLHGGFLDLDETGVGADGARFVARELHAVVVTGIVTGRDHHPTVQSQREDGEIDLLGTDQADVDHLDSRVHQTTAQRLGELRAGQPYVVSHRHPSGMDQASIRTPDDLRQFGVELTGNPAAHVVRLEAIQIVAALHRRDPPKSVSRYVCMR